MGQCPHSVRVSVKCLHLGMFSQLYRQRFQKLTILYLVGITEKAYEQLSFILPAPIWGIHKGSLHQSGGFTKKKAPTLRTKQNKTEKEKEILQSSVRHVENTVLLQVLQTGALTSNSWDQTPVSLNHIKCILFMSVDCIHHRKEMALDICRFQSQMIMIKV